MLMRVRSLIHRLFQMKPEEEPKTEEPNHNARPNLPVMLRRMTRRKMKHQGKEDKRRRPNRGAVMKRTRETTAV